jgi:hypothetical protein
MLTRRYLWPAYFVAFLLIVIPLFDATMSVFPPRFDNAQWRFGALGLLSNAAMIPMTGVLIAFVTAGFLEQRGVQKAIGIVAAIGVVVCLGALVLFTLDAVQAKVGLRPQLQRGYLIASVTAGVKMVLTAVTFGAFAMAGLRGPKGSAARVAASKAGSPMIMSHHGSGRPVSVEPAGAGVSSVPGTDAS